MVAGDHIAGAAGGGLIAAMLVAMLRFVMWILP